MYYFRKEIYMYIYLCVNVCTLLYIYVHIYLYAPRANVFKFLQIKKLRYDIQNVLFLIFLLFEFEDGQQFSTQN